MSHLVIIRKYERELRELFPRTRISLLYSQLQQRQATGLPLLKISHTSTPKDQTSVCVV